MKNFALTLFAGGFALATMVVSANAQTQSASAAALHAQMQNATPIVKNAACRGWGAHCSPGWVWTCNWGRCWCRPCW
jgi:hypothetical protein